MTEKYLDTYEKQAYSALARWEKQMLRRPGIFSKWSKGFQTKINSWIPEKVHVAFTTAVKQMTRAVIFGSVHTTSKPLARKSLELRETAIRERIKNYRNTAAIEGGITGAGGLLLGLADFPLLFSIKIKLLFDIAALYGFDVKNYKERLYILHIFELAFSSPQHRKQVYLKMTDWETRSQVLPDNPEQIDWRKFQQEYRDYLDLAKLAQLIPIIGAPVGIVVNYRLVKKLGTTAMNAYRMRLLK